MLCGSAMCAGMMLYANMHERAGMCYAMLCLQIWAEIKGKWAKMAGEACKIGGIVDILYDGFRKCFVNCKFTFYITLSSYLKKVKIPKTRKNHSKM